MKHKIKEYRLTSLEPPVDLEFENSIPNFFPNYMMAFFKGHVLGSTKTSASASVKKAPLGFPRPRS